MAEDQDQVDFTKLPLEEKCGHKNWKARLSAYEDLLKLYTRIDDDKSPEWTKYIHFIRKIPVDSNAAAVEKGLETVLCFLENSASGPKIVGEVVSGVIAKCFTASRTKTRELSSSIILMSIEIEKYEVVQDELIKGMDHKNPKVISACITIMAQAVKEFGLKILNLKTLLKKVIPFFDDRDKSVRDETKKLTVELFKWMGGAAIRPQLSALKPIVMQELETEFEKVEKEKPVQTRFLRSQQAKREQQRQNGNGNDAEEEEEAEEEAVPEIDPFELLDPVDILSKLPKDFYEKSEAKKWQERKEALEILETLTTSNPKLEQGDYGDLVRCLKRIISKDNNVLCVALAGKCVTGLANGLKKKFAQYASSCIVVIFEKFKEKKANVVTAMREAADACYIVINFESISEDTIVALGSKNPSVKVETSTFLARAFSKTQFKTMTDKKLMKPVYTALITNINESDATVRDASAEALGVAMKSTGEKFFDPFLADIDPLKLQKIKEFCEKAVITVKKEKTKEPSSKMNSARSAKETSKPPLKSASAPSGVSKTAPPKKFNVPPKKQPSTDEIDDDSSKPKGDSPPNSKTRVSRVQPKGRVKSPGKKTSDDPIGSNLQINTFKNQRFTDENKLRVLRWTFTSPREEFIELLKEQMTTANFSKNLMEKLFHIDFKQHLKAIDVLFDEMQQSIEGTMCNLDLIFKWLSIRFFDTNPSVLIRSLDYLSTLFRILGTHSYTMSENEAHCFIPYLLLKIGEPKDTVRLNVHNILRLIYNCYPPAKVYSFVLEGLKGKNARQRAECLDELSYMISTFTISIFQPAATANTVMKEVARQIADRDNSVRNAALNCVVQVYFLEGERVYKMIGQLSDKEQSLLEERIKRAGKGRPPASGSATARINPTKPSTAIVPPKTAPANTSHQYANNINNNSRKSPETVRDHNRENSMGSSGGSCGSSTRPATVESPIKYAVTEGIRSVMEEIDRRFEPVEVGGGRMSPLKLYDTNSDFLDAEVPVCLPPRNRPCHQFSSSGGETLAADGAVQSIDLVVGQVGNNDLRLSMEATIKLEALLSDPEVNMVMAIRIELLLTMVSMQLRKLMALLDICPPVEKLDDMNRLYRCLIQLIHTLYKNNTLATKASTDVVKELILQLLILIVDPKLNKIPDAIFITKQINVMVVRIIEKSDPNAIIIGLVRLMNESIQLNVDDNLLELVLKCQWKLLKQFNAWAEELNNYQYDIDGILKELSNFMKVYTLTSFVKDKDITPMKTMKTILHAIVPLVNHVQLSKKLDNYPDLKNSDPGIYLQKLLQREMDRKKIENNSNETNAILAPRCHLTTTD